MASVSELASLLASSDINLDHGGPGETEPAGVLPSPSAPMALLSASARVAAAAAILVATAT